MRRNSNNTIAMPQQELATIDSPLFRLPGELRNKIYEYALTNDQPVLVNSEGFEVPTLLSTCHAIRSEAMSLFYLHNTFDILFEYFDSTWAVRFLRIAWEHAKVSDWQISMNSLTPVTGTPNWANLELWLCRIRCGVIPSTELYVHNALLPRYPRHRQNTCVSECGSTHDVWIGWKEALNLVDLARTVHKLSEITRVQGPAKDGQDSLMMLDGREATLEHFLRFHRKL